jgi:3-phenylpropionate/trans-cinnamate dioxygenase ferredoxin reductase subunit
MISGEAVPPYDRTLLSKDMLCDAGEPVPLARGSQYTDHGIELLLETTAVALVADAGCIDLSVGTTRPVDRMVLCVGGRPVLPPELNAPGVAVVREAAHITRLRAMLDRGGSLVVIGGGFIGGEVASAAIERGLDVTIVEQAPAPLEPVLGAEVGARVADLHRRRGVKVLTGVTAKAVTATESGYRIGLDDDAALCADAVVVGVGMAPATDWLTDSGLVLDRGIVTDAQCRTSVDTVFAAGDCARWWHPTYERLCRVEHWDTANRHGAAAAKAVLGSATPFTPLPFFWSDQHGVKFQWAGHAPEWDALEVEGDDPERFSARYYRRGRLVAVLTAGQPRAFAKARAELAAL